jgi:hypothetical protein
MLNTRTMAAARAYSEIRFMVMIMQPIVGNDKNVAVVPPQFLCGA